MAKPKKKPKTGDVVGWVVIDSDGDVRSDPMWRTRIQARRDAKVMAKWSAYAPYRVAKVVISH